MKWFSLVAMLLLAATSAASAQSFDQMTSGKDRRNYIENYLRESNLVCPPSGKTKEQEEAELMKHYWITISGYLWATCIHQSVASKVSKPAEVAHAEVSRQPEIQSADSKPEKPEMANFAWPDPPAMPEGTFAARWSAILTSN